MEHRSAFKASATLEKADDGTLAVEDQLLDDLGVRSFGVAFELGDTVVYPHHGVGQVLKKERRKMFGEEREYLTIKILHNDMTVMVPCENGGVAGLRRVIDEETVQKVLAVLADEVSEMPKNWNRRFKHNRDKIKTGDIYDLAEVVRNLAIREHEKGLSTGEKQMFRRAKTFLASELMYALDLNEDDAQQHLDDLLAERSGLALPGGAEAATAPEPLASSAAGDASPRPDVDVATQRRDLLAADVSAPDASERFWVLLAASDELGQTVSEQLADLTLVGQRGPEQETLSLAVERQADALRQHALTMDEVAQRLRTPRF